MLWSILGGCMGTGWIAKEWEMLLVAPSQWVTALMAKTWGKIRVNSITQGALPQRESCLLKIPITHPSPSNRRLWTSPPLSLHCGGTAGLITKHKFLVQNEQKGANGSITGNHVFPKFFWEPQLLEVEEPGTSMVTGLYIHFYFLAIPHYNKHNWSPAGSGCFYIARFTVAGIL